MKKLQCVSSKDISNQWDAVPTGEDLPAVDLQEHIATAAYFRAQERGFEPGQEIDDWLAAETEIKGRNLASREV